MANVDDIYLDDKERAEQVRQWWKENGLSIVGGAVLGLVAIFGWRAWQDYQSDHRQAAAGAFQDFITRSQALSPEEVAAQMAMFKQDFADTPYAAMAALEAARLAYEAEQTDQAAAYYQYAMSEGEPAGVATIARLRLARLQADQGNYEQALLTLNEAASPGAFRSIIAELKGDIYVHLGRVEQARRAYTQAMEGAEPMVTRFLEMKLAALGSGIVAREEGDS